MKYIIVEGLPSDVQKRVDELLEANDGWELNGSLFPRIQDGYHLVVQGMVNHTGDDPQIAEQETSDVLTNTSLEQVIDDLAEDGVVDSIRSSDLLLVLSNVVNLPTNNKKDTQ